MIPQAVKNYLDKFSLGDWKIEAENLENVNAVIVIPAIDEYENLKGLLVSLSKNERKYFSSTLVVIVINNLASSSFNIKNQNEKSLSLVRSIIKNSFEEEKKFVNEIVSSGLRIALVDASSNGKEMPKRDGGVGFARKIGMDLAIRIFDYNSNEKKLIINLDADCIVQENYLREIIDNFNQRNLSAAAVNYEHSIGEGTETYAAIICYEIFLRYYVLGLKYAASPYAFHTIGSTMVCDYDSYIKVEGMNRKKAAEDFYFMEKLAKNFKIENIFSTTVYPSSRKSWRVPFGTGQRVRRFLSEEQNEYLLFDPKSFYILRNWLEVFTKTTNVSVNFYIQAAEKINYNLLNFLAENNFEESMKRIIKNSGTEKQLTLQKMRWFDGFRTLKLIHYLRDNSFPQVNMFDALDELFSNFKIFPIHERRNNPVPTLEIKMKYLNNLRKFS